VRQRLESVFDKTGVHTRRELVGRVFRARRRETEQSAPTIPDR